MDFTAKDNMYQREKQRVLQPFDAVVSGNADASVCVISSGGKGACSNEVLNALDATCEKNNLGEMNFVDALRITSDEAFICFESLDPLKFIVLDESSIQLLEHAYGATCARNAYASLMGRPSVFFSDFSAWLQNPDTKTQAWALLKRL
ncbi:MAG: hypothetical protein IJV62_05135 [Eggerthellaceae bacterium]|nr:hypothetical protein [Eggerthellaceae bacterium]